eukprot:RCo017034
MESTFCPVVRDRVEDCPQSSTYNFRAQHPNTYNSPTPIFDMADADAADTHPEAASQSRSTTPLTAYGSLQYADLSLCTPASNLKKWNGVPSSPSETPGPDPPSTAAPSPSPLPGKALNSAVSARLPTLPPSPFPLQLSFDREEQSETPPRSHSARPTKTLVSGQSAVVRARSPTPRSPFVERRELIGQCGHEALRSSFQRPSPNPFSSRPTPRGDASPKLTPLDLKGTSQRPLSPACGSSPSVVVTPAPELVKVVPTCSKSPSPRSRSLGWLPTVTSPTAVGLSPPVCRTQRSAAGSSRTTFTSQPGDPEWMRQVWNSGNNPGDAGGAVRVIPTYALKMKPSETAIRELELLSKCLECTFIVKVHWIYSEGVYSFLAMEWVSGGSLASIVKARGPLQPASIRKYTEHI